VRFAPRITLLIALVFGLLAALLVRGLLQDRPEFVGRTIVVARGLIPPGTALTAENLREVAWHAADPLEGAYAHVADLVRDGRRLALATIQRNEPILSARVTAPNQRSTLSTQLDDGMRAVTVRVDEVRGVAGFVLPGDRVDVILTRGENGGAESSAFADVLLQNAKVLAVDQIATEGQDKPTVARAVTLELTQQHAQKVVLAQGIGRLSLVLRQANEADDRPSARVTASDLGSVDPKEHDRIADLEKRLESVRKSNDEARDEADRKAAQRLTEMEARMRDLNRPAAFASMGNTPPTKPAVKSSVVNVIRNGSKTESYTVAAER
jgi:pilus assembly protein CpaB